MIEMRIEFVASERNGALKAQHLVVFAGAALEPGRIQSTDARAQVGAERIARRLVRLVSLDTVVDAVDRLDERRVQLQVDCVQVCETSSKTERLATHTHKPVCA